MGILSWIVVGLIAGWLASLFFHTRFGLLGDILLGVVGGLVGGFLATTLFKIPDPLSGFNLSSILTAFAGSVVLLLVIRIFSRGR
jgi:uncharacterized membrane protein YeaQ/YmgE (transglycosylase-associated protein family)